MKIFVAGASGVIGRSLVPQLVEHGHQVLGTTRFPERAAMLAQLGAEPVTVDVYQRDELRAALAQARPDAVIHLLTDLRTTASGANSRIRIEGTRNLVDAARAAGVERVVAESIAFVYAPGEGPASEDRPLDIEAPEPRREGVQAVQALESMVGTMPRGLVLRYGLLYGPDTMYARDGRVGQQVLAGTMAASQGISSFIATEDAAAATVLALDWPPGILNIVDDEPAPGTDWLPVYAKALGAAPPTQVTPAGRGQEGASNRQAHALGWRPRFASWREGFPAVLS